MTHRYASLQGGRMKLRLPMSPLRAEMAMKALEEWRQPEDAGRERHWYKIANAADGDAPTQVNIFDEISWWGISAEQFVADIAGITGDLEVHINSPGGDAFDGITIFNALRSRPGNVGVVVDGLAASAASVIAMGASPGKLVMGPGSMVMIHDALALCIGNEADMLDMAARLGKVSDNIASVYADRTGKPAADWRTAMQAEGWYTPQEAIDAGLADKLAERPGAGDGEPGPAQAPEATWSRSIFAAWQGRPKAADGDGGGSGDGGNCPTCGGSGRQREDSGQFAGSCPDCGGTGNAPDSGDGDGGDDSGIEDRAPAVRAGALPVHHTATVDEPWDGPAAVAAMPNDDTVLKYCHAWEDAAAAAVPHEDGDDDADDQKQNYKFPHHKTKGGPANLNACQAILSNLAGGRSDPDIPAADEAGVRAHAQAHLDDAKTEDGGADDHAHQDHSAAAVERLQAALKGARK